MKLPNGCKYVIGIDEAGRGPLAGPVSVGAICLTAENFKQNFKKFSAGVRDSKQLSEQKREEWLEKIKKAEKDRKLNFSYSTVSSKIIDRKGIVFAVRKAVRRCLEKFDVSPEMCLVLLDGSLKAPDKFLNQKTIIRGDVTVPIISMASVVAKVKRDSRMKRLAKKYTQYKFEIHKGYGTSLHYEMIKKFGMCEIHRKSFLRKLNVDINKNS